MTDVCRRTDPDKYAGGSSPGAGTSRLCHACSASMGSAARAAEACCEHVLAQAALSFEELLFHARATKASPMTAMLFGCAGFDPAMLNLGAQSPCSLNLGALFH